MDTVDVRRANHWFHIPLQIIGLGFCLYFYFHVPKSGKALLILSAIVAVMMLMDMSTVHKGVYVAVRSRLRTHERACCKIPWPLFRILHGDAPGSRFHRYIKASVISPRSNAFLKPFRFL